MRKTHFNISQSNASKRRGSKFLMSALILAVLLIGAAGYFWVNSRSNDEPKSTDDIRDTSKQPGAEGDTGNTESKITESAVAQPPDSIDSTASLEIIEKSSGANGVRVTARATGITPARCQFSFSSPESRPVVKETAAKGVTCGPLEIAAVEFDKIGEWNISVTAYNSEQRVVAEGTLIVQ